MMTTIQKLLFFGLMLGHGAAQDTCFMGGPCPAGPTGIKKHCGYYTEV